MQHHQHEDQQRSRPDRHPQNIVERGLNLHDDSR
jgi:hypothetical protein